MECCKKGVTYEIDVSQIGMFVRSTLDNLRVRYTRNQVHVGNIRIGREQNLSYLPDENVLCPKQSFLLNVWQPLVHPTYCGSRGVPTAQVNSRQTSNQDPRVGVATAGFLSHASRSSKIDLEITD